MKTAKLIGPILMAVIMAAWLTVAAEESDRDQTLLNEGKVFIFDSKYEEARNTFQRLIHEFPKSPLVPQAHYLMARCVQFQGKPMNAIEQYEQLLKSFPNEPFLPQQARNAVTELSASLFEKGNPAFRDRLISALSDPNKEVRYFAAIRSSFLKDRHIASMVVPVLREITARETERELVDRARIALLRLDPKALSRSTEPSEPKKKQEGSEPRVFRIVLYHGASAEPRVDLTFPVSLAQLAIAALDESTKQEIRKKGIDVDNIFEELKRMGPTNILTFRDGPNVIKIWIE